MHENIGIINLGVVWVVIPKFMADEVQITGTIINTKLLKTPYTFQLHTGTPSCFTMDFTECIGWKLNHSVPLTVISLPYFSGMPAML